MAVRLISKTEKNVFEYDGSKFYYRRIPVSHQMVINKRHTKRGIVDHVAAGLEMIEWCLLDWADVLDEQGETVAFDKEMVKDLPDDLVTELTTALRESSPADKTLPN